MELSHYDIIKRPVITDKSIEVFKKFGQLTFEVNKAANKITVRRAVEKIWNVEVDSVRIKNSAGKNKVFARRSFSSPGKKTAIIKLKKGFKIEIPGMFEATGLVGGHDESSTPSQGK